MPELPEVETIKNDLAPLLVGKQFAAVEVLWPNLVKRPSTEEMKRDLPGCRIESLSRRGKYLIAHLSPPTPLVEAPQRKDGSPPLGTHKGHPYVSPSPSTERSRSTPIDHPRMGVSEGPGGEVHQRPPYLRGTTGGRTLIFHLRMTGALLYPASPDKYASAVFTFDDGSQLVFADKRRLGALWLVEDALEVVGKLGPEPLEPEFTVERMASILSRRSAPIKPLLLDQELIAGVGNLYADESLFQAGLHPTRPASSLTSEDIARLYAAIQGVLRLAIEHRGSSFSDYRTPDGAEGTHQECFQVAHRKGQPCPRCGTAIQRLALRNRGAYFCPKCQA